MLAAAPRDVRMPSATGAHFALADELVADHSPDGQHPDVRPVDDAAGRADATDQGPVYRRVPGGDIVVPTGLVLVRFAEDDAAADHRDDLAGAGYELEQVPGYAPQAAWVRATSGDIADALRDIGRLGGLTGVVSVEAQMIGERSPRQ